MDDRCHRVLQAADHCYVIGTGSTDNHYDCALGGEEILSQHLAAHGRQRD